MLDRGAGRADLIILRRCSGILDFLFDTWHRPIISYNGLNGITRHHADLIVKENKNKMSLNS